MRIDAIKFNQHEEGALPSEVTVTMSIVEAAQIACLFGEMSDKMLTDRGWVLTSIYSDLSVNVFNRYWEDGLTEAMRDSAN
jgi:hypothetical protein